MILAVVAVFLVILRLKKRNKGKKSSPAVYARRIEGAQVYTALHAAVPDNCLFDHGLQFGKGFRRKEGPELPHDGDCQCVISRFSYTSTEVFNGALRNHETIESAIAILDNRENLQLIEALKRVAGQFVAENPDSYAAQVLDGDEWKPGSRIEIEKFLRQRHAFLLGGGQADKTSTGDAGRQPIQGDSLIVSSTD